MKSHRRQFLKHIGGVAALSIATPMLNPIFIKEAEAACKEFPQSSNVPVESDEDFWAVIRRAYTSSPGVINLNNGGVSPQPLSVQDALDRYTRFSNEGPAYYMWHVLDKGRETVRGKLAGLAGCSAEELAICRNTTEALETIIYGLNLNEGDEILTSDQDYPNMLNAFRQREKREGIKINYVSIPVPCKDVSEITKIFKKAITPKTKVMLICHMINLTGQILPVREICDMAHKHGIEVIVDGAHTFAHLDYNISDFNCDYFGTSLHKWLCAPFGTGLLYVKKDKIKNLWPLFGSPDPESDDIRKFEHLGTRSFPSELAIGHAIDFHNAIGSERKEKRLRYLKNYWVERVQDIPGVYLNTSLEEEQSCALANFGVESMNPADICSSLFKRKSVYVIAINHDDFKGVRVTPHVYTSLSDLDLLVQGVKELC